MLADSRENRLAGILWMLATMFCFISLDAMMKHLLETYSLAEVTWGRFFFATITVWGATIRSRSSRSVEETSSRSRPTAASSGRESGVTAAASHCTIGSGTP